MAPAGVCEVCALGKRDDGDSSIVNQEDERLVCLCGNKFMPDAVFCRKCGRKRPEDTDFSPECRFVAWIRRRNGSDCDFGHVFKELFGEDARVAPRHFAEVLKRHGYRWDAKAIFACIDRDAKSGMLGASDLELYQMKVEEIEAEGLKHLRHFLKQKFQNPAKAFEALGKGEGDSITEWEFSDAIRRLGFTDADPERLFHFMDKDYSGDITFAEFKSLMRHAIQHDGKVHKMGSMQVLEPERGGHHKRGSNEKEKVSFKDGGERDAANTSRGSKEKAEENKDASSTTRSREKEKERGRERDKEKEREDGGKMSRRQSEKVRRQLSAPRRRKSAGSM